MAEPIYHFELSIEELDFLIFCIANHTPKGEQEMFLKMNLLHRFIKGRF